MPFKTVIESPQAIFRREAGLSPTVSHARVGVGSWMKLGLGDLVRERDGRHVGRVEAIHWSNTVKVRWLETGWVSEVPLNEIERQADNESCERVLDQITTLLGGGK
jgi:hypothetical protein